MSTFFRCDRPGCDGEAVGWRDEAPPEWITVEASDVYGVRVTIHACSRAHAAPALDATLGALAGPGRPDPGPSVTS